MAYINDYVFDAALTKLDTETSHLTINSQEPTTFAEAYTTYILGFKSGVSVGAPTDRSPNGRKVVVAAITDGTVNVNGTASHWALIDHGNSRLLSTGSLAASQVVTSGNIFTTSAFDIGIPDAV